MGVISAGTGSGHTHLSSTSNDPVILWPHQTLPYMTLPAEVIKNDNLQTAMFDTTANPPTLTAWEQRNEIVFSDLCGWARHECTPVLATTQKT